MKEVKVCSVEMCASKVNARGLCRPHYLGPCSVDGCTTTVHARGFCGKHDTNPKVDCSVEGCGSKVRARGLCSKHGASGFCSTAGCNTAANGRGVCKKHSTKGVCSFKDCTTYVVARGRCWLHGGGSKKVCKIEGCSTFAHARGLCTKHGANRPCTFDGCTTTAQSGFNHYCRKHGGGSKKTPCSVAGCITASIRKGLCAKHGACGTCQFAGCTTNAQRGSKHCYKHSGVKKKQSNSASKDDASLPATQKKCTPTLSSTATGTTATHTKTKPKVIQLPRVSSGLPFTKEQYY